jgi:heptosyltransferase-2
VRILVLHPGALGDIILALPALDALRENAPGAEVTVAGNRDCLDAVAFGHADRMLSLGTLPLHHLYAPGPLPPQDLEFWRSFDRIISWTGAGDRQFEHNLREIHPDVRIASARPAPEETRHVSQIFVDSLDLPGRIEAGLARVAPPAVAPREKAAIALHPGAGSREKRWPAERFRALARRLADRGEQVVLLEGPAENGLGRTVAEGLSEENVQVVSGVPLAELVTRLACCRGFVGNDSGVSHLAAALGVPTVALFGPTRPEHWAPRGERVRVLLGRNGRFDEISVNDCAEAVAQLRHSH